MDSNNASGALLSRVKQEPSHDTINSDTQRSRRQLIHSNMISSHLHLTYTTINNHTPMPRSPSPGFSPPHSPVVENSNSFVGINSHPPFILMQRTANSISHFNPPPPPFATTAFTTQGFGDSVSGPMNCATINQSVPFRPSDESINNSSQPSNQPFYYNYNNYRSDNNDMPYQADQSDNSQLGQISLGNIDGCYNTTTSNIASNNTNETGFYEPKQHPLQCTTDSLSSRCQTRSQSTNWSSSYRCPPSCSRTTVSSFTPAPTDVNQGGTLSVKTSPPNKIDDRSASKSSASITFSRASYMCRKCKTHGHTIPVKRHKRNCPFLNCTCLKCQLVDQGRKVVAKQIALYRDQKGGNSSSKTRRGDSPPEPSQGQKANDQAASSLPNDWSEMASDSSSCSSTSSRRSLTTTKLPSEFYDQQALSWSDPTKVASNNGPHCRRCRNHSLAVTWKGHKKSCPYRNCPCAPCRLINVRKDTEKTLREMASYNVAKRNKTSSSTSSQRSGASNLKNDPSVSDTNEQPHLYNKRGNKRIPPPPGNLIKTQQYHDTPSGSTKSKLQAQPPSDNYYRLTSPSDDFRTRLQAELPLSDYDQDQINHKDVKSILNPHLSRSVAGFDYPQSGYQSIDNRLLPDQCNSREHLTNNSHKSNWNDIDSTDTTNTTNSNLPRSMHSNRWLYDAACSQSSYYKPSQLLTNNDLGLINSHRTTPPRSQPMAFSNTRPYFPTSNHPVRSELDWVNNHQTWADHDSRRQCSSSSLYPTNNSNHHHHYHHHQSNVDSSPFYSPERVSAVAAAAAAAAAMVAMTPPIRSSNHHMRCYQCQGEVSSSSSQACAYPQSYQSTTRNYNQQSTSSVIDSPPQSTIGYRNIDVYNRSWNNQMTTDFQNTTIPTRSDSPNFRSPIDPSASAIQVNRIASSTTTRSTSPPIDFNSLSSWSQAPVAGNVIEDDDNGEANDSPRSPVSIQPEGVQSINDSSQLAVNDSGFESNYPVNIQSSDGNPTDILTDSGPEISTFRQTNSIKQILSGYSSLQQEPSGSCFPNRPNSIAFTNPSIYGRIDGAQINQSRPRFTTSHDYDQSLFDGLMMLNNTSCANESVE